MSFEIFTKKNETISNAFPLNRVCSFRFSDIPILDYFLDDFVPQIMKVAVDLQHFLMTQHCQFLAYLPLAVSHPFLLLNYLLLRWPVDFLYLVKFLLFLSVIHCFIFSYDAGVFLKVPYSIFFGEAAFNSVYSSFDMFLNNSLRSCCSILDLSLLLSQYIVKKNDTPSLCVPCNTVSFTLFEISINHFSGHVIECHYFCFFSPYFLFSATIVMSTWYQSFFVGFGSYDTNEAYIRKTNILVIGPLSLMFWNSGVIWGVTLL